MAARRFVAPARAEVPAACWRSPVFAAFGGYREWFEGEAWPDIARMSAPLCGRRHVYSGAPLAIVEQTEPLLADGLHYEQRVYERGQIATRGDNWHDLFNAVIWAEQPTLKSALNARQYADLQRIGARERTRGQCALTQFDEAGAVVIVRDSSLLAHWDRHAWSQLFWDARDAWLSGAIEAHLFGHALLEHALHPAMLLVAKCLVVMTSEWAFANVEDCVADAVARGHVLQDPQELRPLPLSGIPGWHPSTDQPAFYRDAPCFRPVRPGRQYPAPITPNTRP